MGVRNEEKVDIKAIIAKADKGIGEGYEFIGVEEEVRRKHDCIVIASRLYRNDE